MRAGLLAALLGLAAAALPARVAAQALVVRAERLHPVSGPVIDDGAVWVEDGRIRAVGAAGDLGAPEELPRLEAAVVTPGLIDAHTSVGLAGMLNVPADRDANEATDPDQSALRAIDGFNPREPLLRHLLEHGVTLVQTGPGPANPIAGQAGIFRTFAPPGATADAMAVRFPSAMVFSLGEEPKSTYRDQGGFPTTRMGTAALIRERIRAGARHRRAREGAGGWLGRLAGEPEVAPGLDALGAVAAGELPALFTAHRADDVLTALRIARELGLDAVLAGGSEAYLVREALSEAGVPVLVGPVMERVSSVEHLNASYEGPALLAEAGIPIALRSGYEAYVPRARIVLFEAAVAAANGLGFDAALEAITLGAARRLRIDADHGSLEPGKVADLVLFDGDPFEYASHVEAVVVAGEIAHRRETPGTR